MRETEELRGRADENEGRQEASELTMLVLPRLLLLLTVPPELCGTESMEKPSQSLS